VRTFRSIEFRDNEGEYVIIHEFMNDEEAASLMKRLIESDATDAIIYDLTPTLFDDTTPKIESPK